MMMRGSVQRRGRRPVWRRSPLHAAAAVGLSEYMPLFQSEQIDLEALSLLSEEDLKALGMPLGPRGNWKGRPGEDKSVGRSWCCTG
ncbi:hypothetical protein CEXT_163891 [Caerostris extrusa]|uniref:SAM domain-containing protein n=1 Tax=Caerostris extrusa TaxID=172846 RepID=A0AAV4SX91_CAEEX|nr:hypothetical protein CEXT_163891 [Caerostris extrusa]